MDKAQEKEREKEGARAVLTFGKQLYHYTSIPTLSSIIKKKQLWLGNTETMNDRTEIIHFVNKLKDATIEDYPSKAEEINDIWVNVEKGLQEPFPYAMCFSSHLDDAAQWERYAARATGVCLVANSDVLRQLFLYHQAYLNHVFYDNDIRQHDHYQILSHYLAECKWPYSWDDHKWVDNMIATAPNYKHGSFSRESEIRLIIYSEFVQYGENEGIYTLDYEVIGNQIKPVLKVDLEKLCAVEGIGIDTLFDGIVIGPKSAQNKDILASFCRENGFHKLAENISLSECPLR